MHAVHEAWVLERVEGDGLTDTGARVQLIRRDDLLVVCPEEDRGLCVCVCVCDGSYFG